MEPFSLLPQFWEKIRCLECILNQLGLAIFALIPAGNGLEVFINQEIRHTGSFQGIKGMPGSAVANHLIPLDLTHFFESLVPVGYPMILGNDKHRDRRALDDTFQMLLT